MKEYLVEDEIYSEFYRTKDVGYLFVKIIPWALIFIWGTVLALNIYTY